MTARHGLQLQITTKPGLKVVGYTLPTHVWASRFAKRDQTRLKSANFRRRMLQRLAEQSVAKLGVLKGRRRMLQRLAEQSVVELGVCGPTMNRRRNASLPLVE
ncbi:hypothetical protein KIN20_020165 [Parelaphostrongylus tenuis]|uniref:Uncharacterized protein n=1 Tax=Parelaphostrongylus tenuis TaxID=148309 RepID=A0AAD5QQM6_PARTN|nr:hypothetical protein KIN20_020165 [Parelaphostrongylus tenuis]